MHLVENWQARIKVVRRGTEDDGQLVAYNWQGILKNGLAGPPRKCIAY